MRHFNHPSPVFIGRVSFFLLNFFPALFYVGNIVSVHDRLISRFAGIPLVCAKMLFDTFRTCDDDFIKHQFKLCHIVAIGSGDDDR